MPFEVALLEAEEWPVCQKIAGEAERLLRLGMNYAKIPRRLGIDAKTVAKATAWATR